MKQQPAFSTPIKRQTLWIPAVITSLATGFVLWLYWTSAAPGLTWAHAGADGGDLIAAALVNGVPHPTGYPLYTLLLRAWLGLGETINANLEPAYWGNRLSALCVALAVAFTIQSAAALLHKQPLRWLWAALAGIAFALTPLAWSQALITEVYALHALLTAAFGWALLRRSANLLDAAESKTFSPLTAIGVGLLMGLGASHHFTSILLWPALFYWQITSLPRQAWLRTLLLMVVTAFWVAALFYAGMVWRVAAADSTPAVAWGYPRGWSGLWWLVSGEAYRSYVFGMSPVEYVGRLAALARLLVEQFTPLGLALVIGGFAVWDRQRSVLRNGALLWILPVSLYAAGYSTIDSYVYLLPVAWVMALMLAQGLASGSAWLAERLRAAPIMVAALAVVGLIFLAVWRLPEMDLRHDREAQEFLENAITTLEANSLVLTNADAPTFALWYGQWGSGVLAREVPDLIIVNYALYQFGWYRDLMHDLYADIPMMGSSLADLINENRSQRAIYLTEPLPALPSDELTPRGAFWRLNPP